MSASNSSQGRSPSMMSRVGDTTRRVAASLHSRVNLTKTTGRSSLQEPSTDTVQEELAHVEDPEEPSTTLTRLASERPNPLADLESLLPVRHDFDDETGFVALCNDLLVLNYQEHRDPTRRTIKIPGTTGVFISPNQFYHAWHLLSQRGRDLNGGILADEAGTGKTYVYFAAALLRALAWESKRAVQLYWNGKGKKKVGRNAEHHLPEGGNGRSCPSQKQSGIVCYCVPGSLTRTICDHTPSGVSALYLAAESWPDLLNMVQTAGLNPSVYQLCLVHNNAPTRFTRPLQPLVQTLAHGAEPDLKNPSPASYIFVTTLESPRLRNIFSERTLSVGFALIDEAHQILRTKESLTLRMAEEFSQNGADVWFVTATPFSGCSLEHWVRPMKCIAPRRASSTQGLATALDLARFSCDEADILSFQVHFRAIFDRNLVLRHLGTSTFLGTPISDVQDIVPRYVSRNTPRQHRTAVQELASQIAGSDPRLSDPAQRGLLYLVSLFPAAAELILEDPIALDTASIRDNIRQTKNRLRIEESEPLRRLADRIVKNSPKLDCILDEIQRMGQDQTERAARADNQAAAPPRFGAGEDLRMKKMVIITPTVVSAVFLYLAVIRHRPDVALIHNWVSSQEKEQVVNSFRSLSAAKLVRHTRILIAPFAAIGTGANLQVASYQILTSPLPDRASQVQAFARTNRSGQRLRPLHHKVLVLEDSPVDRIVLASHATVEIGSDPFNISEPLRIDGHAELSSVGSSLSNPDSPTGAVEDQVSSTHGSTLGVDEGLVFQNPLPALPRPPTRGHNQVRDLDSETSLSSAEADEALLLQNASFWAPVSATGAGRSIPDAHGQHDLFTDVSSSDSSSSSSTGGRPGVPGRSMSAMPERHHTFGTTHGQPTPTPVPRPSSMPAYRHRPLPPLPTRTQSAGRDDSPTLGVLSLFPPPPSGPPARVDVGPSLASRQDPFASTAEGSRPVSPISDDDGDRGDRDDRDDAVSLRPVIEFEWIERPLTPYPEEMREHEITNARESGRDRDLRDADFDVDHLIRMARETTTSSSSARLREENDQPQPQPQRHNTDDDWARLEEEARQRQWDYEEDRLERLRRYRDHLARELRGRRLDRAGR